jgi:hypothetical protein
VEQSYCRWVEHYKRRADKIEVEPPKRRIVKENRIVEARFNTYDKVIYHVLYMFIAL